MHDPLNQLPADPDWVRLVDALGEMAAQKLGCMVVMIAMQDGGKLSLSVDGVPDTGPLALLAQDMPRMLEVLAMALRKQEATRKAGPQQ
jgi:hypothetical protein